MGKKVLFSRGMRNAMFSKFTLKSICDGFTSALVSIMHSAQHTKKKQANSSITKEGGGEGTVISEALKSIGSRVCLSVAEQGWCHHGRRCAARKKHPHTRKRETTDTKGRLRSEHVREGEAAHTHQSPHRDTQCSVLHSLHGVRHGNSDSVSIS